MYACIFLNTKYCLISLLSPQRPGYHEGLSKPNNTAMQDGQGKLSCNQGDCISPNKNFHLY